MVSPVSLLEVLCNAHLNEGIGARRQELGKIHTEQGIGEKGWNEPQSAADINRASPIAWLSFLRKRLERAEICERDTLQRPAWRQGNGISELQIRVGLRPVAIEIIRQSSDARDTTDQEAMIRVSGIIHGLRDTVDHQDGCGT